ncbi:MAG: tetratricopeptide repeat protein [Planctomycetes bacterium]|nr:tetratricopeptide repeat protein [Planctomycetota bacterium]
MSGETLRIRQFHTEDEFRAWWESTEIIQLRQGSSGELESLKSHPWIKPWLDKMPGQGPATAAPTVQAPALSGEQFGKYTVERKLGQGGMGAVYLAFDTVLKRRVALKVMSGEDADSRERFLREAQASAKLRHPHIIQVFEIGTEGRYHYFTMEYIEGGSLHDLIGSGASPRQIAEIVAKIASALHYAHSQQLVHRDIKPANILIDQKGEPYLTDFGLAKELTGLDRALTMSGMVVGTPDYMSPEQAKGDKDKMDSRSDIFSLGATLYHSLTGRLPFQGKELYEVMEKVVHYDPAPPTRLVRNLARDIETICLKCLEKEPTSRYQTGQELSDDLLRFVRGELIMARPSGLVTMVYKKAAKNKIASLAIAGALAVLIAVGAWLMISSARNKELVVKYRLEAEELYRRNDYNEAKVRASKALALLPDDRAMQDLIIKCDEVLNENEAQAKKARDARDRARGVLGRMKSMDKPIADDRIKVAEDALKIDPGFDEAWMTLGYAYMDKVDFYKAEQAFGKAIESNPQLAYAYYELALISRDIRKNNKKALADFGKVIEFDPGSHIGYFAKGIIEYQQGHIDEAIKCFGEAVRQKRDYAEAYENLAVAKSDKGDTEGALKDYEKAIQLKPGYADAYYNRGTTEYNKGDLAGALKDFDKAIELGRDDKNIDAYYSRGLTKYKQGDSEGALRDFDKVIELDPEHSNAYIWRGFSREKKGDAGGAMDDYNRAVELNAGDNIVYYNRGALKYNRDDIEGAMEDFEVSIRINPNYAQAYCKRGIIKKDRGDIEGAIADYDRAIRLNPDLAVAYNSRGLARLVRRDIEDALKDFNMAIQLNPEDAVAYTSRGNIRDMKNDSAGALEDYNKSIEINPNYANAYFNRGVTRADRGDIEGAMKDYDRAIELDPKDARAYYSRGISKYDLKDAKGALKDYDKAIEFNPEYGEAYYNRGVVRSRKGDADGAIKDFTNAIRINPNRADAYMSRGIAREKKLDINGAIDDYGKAIQLEPGNAGAYNNRGMAKANKGDAKGAINDFDKAVELKPDYAEAYHSRGVVKYNSGDVAGAVKDFTRAVEIRPDYARAYYYRGVALNAQQKYDPALADFEKVLELDSGSELKVKAREMIERIKGKQGK